MLFLTHWLEISNYTMYIFLSFRTISVMFLSGELYDFERFMKS